MPAIVLLLLLSAPESVFDQRPLALEGHLGLGTPLGFGGVALDYAPVGWLSLNLGAGLGASGLPPQVAVTARARPIGGFGIGVGGSAGPYRWVEGGILSLAVDQGAEKRWRFAIWLNGDLSYEFRAESGFLLRSYAGAGYLLNNGAGACVRSPAHCGATHENGGRVLIFTGLSVGYAFSL